MDLEQLKETWLSEERRSFQGWDFSSIANRTSSEALPWDYKRIIQSHMESDMRILDMGTGGGEFLVSLNPTRGMTYATEGYLPNYKLSKDVLSKRDVKVFFVDDDDHLPFQDGFFDLVINRHESFSAAEVHRILKPGGLFLTQQVGGKNNQSLSSFLLEGDFRQVDDSFNLQNTIHELERNGFLILDQDECFPMLTFYDVGALVYFAKVIEWEFPNFTLEKCFSKLVALQEVVETHGFVESQEHRFFIAAKKVEE